MNLGRIAIVPQGDYNLNKQYKKLDLVQLDGSSFIALTFIDVGQTPLITPDKWMLSGQRGEQGIKGNIGLSAYESYVLTTSDSPVLTEQEWSSYKRLNIAGNATQANAPTVYTPETYPDGLFETYVVREPLTMPNSWGSAVTQAELDANFVFFDVTNGVAKKVMSVKLNGIDGKEGSDVLVSKNLFDKTKVIPDLFINTGGGLTSQPGQSMITGWIKIDGDTIYYLSGRTAGSQEIRFKNALDEIKPPVNVETGADITNFTYGYNNGLVRSPIDAVAIQFTLKLSNIGSENGVQLEKGIIATPYSDFKKDHLDPTILRKSNKYLEDKIDDITTDSSNLFDKDNVIPDSYLNTITGAVQTLSGANISNLMPVVGGEVYLLSGRRNDSISREFRFLNNLGVSLKAINPLTNTEYSTFELPTVNGLVKAPTTAVFAQFTSKWVGQDAIDYDDISFSKASEFTSYEPFGTVIDGNKLRIKDKVLSHKDMTTTLVMGSSHTESYYMPKGFAWIERINDMVDVNITNGAYSGRSLKTNMDDVRLGGYLTNSVYSANQIKPNFIVWNNSSNFTSKGITGYNELLNAKEMTEALGAKMLLGSEEDWRSGYKDYIGLYKSFAEKFGLKYSSILRLYFKLNIYAYPYAGLLGSGHAGYRTMAQYIEHRKLYDSLSIEKSVKMFKVRPAYKSGSPSITDLEYDDNEGRLKYWTAISTGELSSLGTGNMDNMGVPSYDVPNGLNNGVSINEVALMKMGQPINFNKYGLIEFILPSVKVTQCSFSIKSSVAPTQIYVAINKNSTLDTYTKKARTTFKSIPFTYNDGVVTALVFGEDIQLYDKIRLVIKCNSTFDLSEPTIYLWNGIDKVLSEKEFTDRKFGTELNPITSFPSSGSGWTLTSGVSIKQFPAEIANYTDYNAEKSHLEIVNDSGTATKTITLSEPCQRVAVRIVAQHFYKLATTRFVGTAIENSEYISALAPQVKNYDYDYGTIQIIINDCIVRNDLVLQGWFEIYFEVDIDVSDTQFKIELSRKNIIDETINNDVPLLVHDVSISKIY